MADIAPNLELRRKKIAVQVQELQLSRSRMELRQMELQDELQKITANLAANDHAVKELEKELSNG